MNMRDFIAEYESTRSGFILVAVESLITGIIAGISMESWGAGILAFFVTMFLFYVPVVGGTLMLVFSLMGSFIIGFLLAKITTPIASLIIGCIGFLILMSLHHAAIGIVSDLFGYSLLLFEILIISFFVYGKYRSIPFAVIAFIVLLIGMFLPYIRYIESIALAIFMGVIVYLAIESYMDNQTFSVIFSALISLISLVFFIIVNKLFGMEMHFSSKKEREEARQQTLDSIHIRSKVYERWPELEKVHYFYMHGVCEDESEQEEFEIDWTSYLKHMDGLQEFKDFNQWFDENKVYRYRNYNREFINYFENQRNKTQQDNKHESDGVPDYSGGESGWFKGVNDVDGLKKRYRDLLKIYHPDNNNGDTTITQKIQSEYELLLIENNWS